MTRPEIRQFSEKTLMPLGLVLLLLAGAYEYSHLVSMVEENTKALTAFASSLSEQVRSVNDLTSRISRVEGRQELYFAERKKHAKSLALPPENEETRHDANPSGSLDASSSRAVPGS